LNAKPTTTNGGASKKAPSRRTSKDAKKRSPAASPRKAFGIARDDENEFSFSALAGDGDAWKNLPASPSPSAAGCSLHDLRAEEKRKVAKLIRQVVEYADARKKLEAGLKDATEACERERERARRAEEEAESVKAKLSNAFALIRSYQAQIRAKDDELARRAVAVAAPLPSPSPPAKAALVEAPTSGAVVVRAATAAAAAELEAAATPPPPPPREDDVEEEEEEDDDEPAEESEPEPGTPPVATTRALVVAAAASSPFIPGLSPVSSRDLRRLSRLAGAPPPPTAVVVKAAGGSGNEKSSKMASAAAAAAARVMQHRESAESPTTAATETPSPAATLKLTLSPSPSPEGMGAEETESTTPLLPQEVRDAAAAAAAADPNDALVAALAAGAAAAGEARGANGEGAMPPPPPTTTRQNRVLRFDPSVGAAGAFYFSDASVTPPTAATTAAAASAISPSSWNVDPGEEEALRTLNPPAAAPPAVPGLDQGADAFGSFEAAEAYAEAAVKLEDTETAWAEARAAADAAEALVASRRDGGGGGGGVKKVFKIVRAAEVQTSPPVAPRAATREAAVCFTASPNAPASPDVPQPPASFMFAPRGRSGLVEDAEDSAAAAAASPPPPPAAVLDEPVPPAPSAAPSAATRHRVLTPEEIARRAEMASRLLAGERSAAAAGYSPAASPSLSVPDQRTRFVAAAALERAKPPVSEDTPELVVEVSPEEEPTTSAKPCAHDKTVDLRPLSYGTTGFDASLVDLIDEVEAMGGSVGRLHVDGGGGGGGSARKKPASGPGGKKTKGKKPAPSKRHAQAPGWYTNYRSF